VCQGNARKMPASRLAPLSPAGSRRFSASYITPYNAQESKIWRQGRPLRREDSNCPMTAEADISDFEILCARPVNGAARFAGGNGHTRGRGFSQGIARSPDHSPGPVRHRPLQGEGSQYLRRPVRAWLTAGEYREGLLWACGVARDGISCECSFIIVCFPQKRHPSGGAFLFRATVAALLTPGAMRTA